MYALYIYGPNAIYPQGFKVTPDNFVAGHKVICALLICYFKRTKVSSAFKTQRHNGTPLSLQSGPLSRSLFCERLTLPAPVTPKTC